MATSRPTVVVIDDAPEVRALVKTRLRLSGLLDVVADGADGTEAISLAHLHQPTLMLLDMSMPSMDGIDALNGVLAVSPDTRVAVFTGFDADGLGDLAIDMGAAAFFQKSDDLDTLAERLLAVAQGEPPRLPADLPPRPQTATGDRPSHDRAVLNEHLERFREVFDEAAIGMATLTLTGGIVRANRAFGSLVQHPHEDLAGVDYAALMAGQGALLDDALERINKEAVELIQVEHLVSGARSSRRVLATLAPVRDSSGQALYVFLQLRDITEQRAAEDELRSSEERFRLLVEAVEDYAIFMLSPDGIVSSWNAGAERTKGYRADEIIGRHFRTFYDEQLQRSGHPERELEMALRDGQYSEEGWRVRKDGSKFWAHVLITALFDSGGNHVGFSKVTRDITPSRAAQESLRQSEERFRLIVDAVRDYAIFMLDPTGHIASWNAGAQRTKGYTASEIVGQHFRVFYPPELQESRHPEHELELALRDGSYSEEGWRVRRDGTRFWAHVTITAVFNEVGDHLGFSKVTRDTTAQRIAEQEREQAAKELAAANTSLKSLNSQLQHAASDQSQFLAVTAHELRTPVAVLGGTANLLSKHWSELGESERQTLLEGMTSSAGRLQRLLSDLLTASKLDASALRLELAPTSLTQVVTVAVQSVRRTAPDADVTVTPHEDVIVNADAARLAQAMDNLLENALRHGRSPVCVEVDRQGDVARVRVIDRGPGVRADVRPRLFQRFATGDEITGTGLGLFIVRELARAHGGDADYEDPTPERPAGAFLLTLPTA
ncbi:PAS domain S-box protein [Aeromicrobium wangtongii]|uniref:Sensor-like histidine kinase SenX3 n=1 Tax=Aeromicrobium wangtongii TaxID=2969247 RepID=A0ABY5M219_9ACTN|nr:PAS domain S-box protein [Aeromicrobium wangtongii]MCD9198209.1 PAS domain S-box protein [Aeromicrobium wangtongii]UUP12245.1 PAS domain S-box protein [Aeromicrobium wangtongii]